MQVLSPLPTPVSPSLNMQVRLSLSPSPPALSLSPSLSLSLSPPLSCISFFSPSSYILCLFPMQTIDKEILCIYRY